MRYEFGIIFDFTPYLKRNDPACIFSNTDHERLLTEILRYITEDPNGSKGSNVEDLLSALIEEDVLYYHVILRNKEPYIDIASILLNICNDLVGVLLNTGFFEHCRSYSKDKPEVRRTSANNYAIMTGRKMR